MACTGRDGDFITSRRRLEREQEIGANTEDGALGDAVADGLVLENDTGNVDGVRVQLGRG